jgi:hypothetical protein
MQAYNIPRRKLIIMTKYYRVTCDSDNYDVAAKVAMHGSLADQSRDYVNQWGMSILPGSSLNLIFEARMANSVNTSRAFQGINIQRS